MAFEAKKINPIDLQPRKAVGVSLPFTGLGVFNSTYTTRDAIRNNLINFFLTGRGERFLNPNIGAGLRNLLFEQLTEEKIEVIDAQVRSSLRTFFPTVEPVRIKTQGSADQNTVTFSMRYKIRNTDITDDVTINFEV